MTTLSYCLEERRLNISFLKKSPLLISSDCGLVNLAWNRHWAPPIKGAINCVPMQSSKTNHAPFVTYTEPRLYEALTHFKMAAGSHVQKHVGQIIGQIQNGGLLKNLLCKTVRTHNQFNFLRNITTTVCLRLVLKRDGLRIKTVHSSVGLFYFG